MRELSHQWTTESVERKRLAAELAEVRLDLNQSVESHQRCLKDLGHLTVEVGCWRKKENEINLIGLLRPLFLSVGGNAPSTFSNSRQLSFLFYNPFFVLLIDV